MSDDAEAGGDLDADDATAEWAGFDDEEADDDDSSPNPTSLTPSKKTLPA